MAMLPPDDGVARAVAAGGWRLVDPRPISADMRSYRDFIAGSRGEFTVAKDIYVRPNSGWFSDRSVCYLAAGRPVVTMRTGFSKFYPVGGGLFEYSNHEEALAGIDAIAADYPGHSRAARELAGEYFAPIAFSARCWRRRVVSRSPCLDSGLADFRCSEGSGMPAGTMLATPSVVDNGICIRFDHFDGNAPGTRAWAF